MGLVRENSGTLLFLANDVGCKVEGLVLWVEEGEGGGECFVAGDGVVLGGVEVKREGVLDPCLMLVVGSGLLGLSPVLVRCRVHKA